MPELGEVVSMCAALRQAADQLYLDVPNEQELYEQLAELESRCVDAGNPSNDVLGPLKRIRYILLESAGGPLAPFLLDSLAELIGDGHGKLFFKPPS